MTGFLALGKGCSIEPEVDLTGYWVDGDVLRVGEVRVGPRARVGARSMLCPGADVGDDAEVAAGSAVFGTVPGGRVLVRRARGPRLRRGARPVVGAAGRARRAWVGGVRRRRGRCSPCCPAVAVAAGGALALGGRRPRRAATASATWPSPCCPGWCPAPWSAWLRAGAAGARRRPAGRARAGARRLPGPQPGRAPGVGDDAGARRGAHLAVPALLLDADAALAAAARCPDRQGRRGLDGADDPVPDHGQRPRVPRRRHPDRRLRARRRLAAHRAGQDRQARLRRQLRHGGAGPQGAQAGPGRGAVGRPAPQDREGGGVLAGQPAGAAAAYGRSGRGRAHLRAAHPAPGRPRALWEAARLVPVLVSVVLYGAVVPGRARRPRRGRRGAGWLLPGVLAVVAGAAASPALSAPRSRRCSRSGCSSGGSGPAPTRCGARSSGATSSPTPSSRWSRRRGSRAR